METKAENLPKLMKIVCPRPEDLSVIINNVRCEECGLSFSNEPRLRMHVLKIHEHKNLKKCVKEDARYHCPEIMCVYSLKSERYFTTMKYLKQHYLKVHAAKTFACTQCDKSFSTEAVKLAHLRVCGVQFTCSCLRVFGTYEALLTHGRRMAHSIDEKYKKTLVRRTIAKVQPVASLVQVASQRGNKPVSILPHVTESGTQVAFDVAVQTDDIKRYKRTSSPSKTCKRRESRQTQTGVLSKESRIGKTVETQTSQATKAITESQKSRATSATLKKHKSSFVKDLSLNENFSAENLFPGSPLQLQHDVGLQDYWEKNTSLGTQTSPEKDLLDAFNDNVVKTELVSFYDRSDTNCLDIENKNNGGALAGLAYVEDTTSSVVENGCYSFNTTGGISRSDPMLTVDSFTDRYSSIETQTEMAYSSSRTFFDPGSPLVGRSFALSSNTETQTTENFDNMEQLLYSNTCTQTCNDILPSDLGLSDIQTQTAWPELEDGSISAQTQTRATSFRTVASNDISTISSSDRSWLNTRTNHTETQTDLLSIFDEFQ